MSGYLELADQRVFVAEYGAGEPLFLLHGGMVAADSWQFQIPALAERYHIFVPERRGHGRTPDVPGPYTTENMAAETVAVMEALVGGPDHFDTVLDKVMTMWRNPLDIPFAEMAKITAPTLIMQGDDDGVRIDYSAALARTLPRAQLAVIPGTGHGAPIQKPDLVNRMILDFLAPAQPERLIALGSLHDAPRMPT